MSLSVLITNITLGGRTGTEIVTRDLALGLLGAGHRPMVFTPRPGPLADQLAAAGVPVVDDITALPHRPDVIHGHHVIQTGIACAAFPDTPAVFVCHDAVAWHDAAPRLPNIRGWAVVNEAFRPRLAADAGVDPDRIELMLNGVDTDRFRPGPDLPPRPRRALAFAKNSGHLEAIREACAARDITLDVVGSAVGRVDAAPEALLNGHDLIFASALTAIEAMACERAVIVCDGRGLAGFVRPTVYKAWRRFNFGLGVFTRPLTAKAVGAEIDRYDAASAHAVGERLRQDANLAAWTDQWIDLYRRLIAEPVVAQAADWAPALAAHLQRWDPARTPAPWLVERAALIETADRLASGLAPLEPGVSVHADETDRLALTGFHPPEPWGAWSARSQAGIRLRLASSAAPDRIRLRVAPFALPDRPGFRLDLTVNGRPLGEVVLTDTVIDAVFPLALLPDETDLWITVRTDPCVAPAEVGVSSDSRPLGFALNAVEIA